MPEKKKGGRPAKPDNERKKNRTFRLAPDTLDKLEWLAKKFHKGNVTEALEGAIGASYVLANKPAT